MILFAVVWWVLFYVKKPTSVSYSEKNVYMLFLGHWGLYIIFSLLVTGAFLSSYRIEQYLYILNWVVVAVLIRKVEANFTPRPILATKWGKNFVLVLASIAILTLILINSHGELKNVHKRFGAPPPVEEVK
jgi:cytochrome b561